MPERHSIYTPNQSKNLALMLIILTGVFLSITSLSILSAILTAAIFYILFKPIFLYLTHKRKLSKSLSATLVIILSFLLVVVPLAGLSVMLFNKLSDFQSHPEVLGGLSERVQKMAGSGVNLKEMISKSVNDISKWAISALSVFLTGAIRVFISLIVMYFTLFFMYRSHEDFERTLMRYLPFKHENSLEFGKELKKMTYSNILGQGFIAVTQGAIVLAGFLIFKIPDAVFWGVVSVFVCFLPVVGAPIIFVPAGIIELASGNTFGGVGILLWGGILVTLVDNFLRQFITRKMADTHPLITIIGVIIGVPVFGLIGLVIGPFMISFFILLCRMYVANYMTADHTPGK